MANDRTNDRNRDADRNRDNANPGSQRDNQANPRDPNLSRDNDGRTRQQQAEQGRGAGARHLQQGSRIDRQLDENQSQSDRNPREGGNRQQQQHGDKSGQMGAGQRDKRPQQR